MELDPRWKTPFRCIISGPSGCGKTYFVERFIRNIGLMTDPPPTEIIWAYAEWQPTYDRLRPLGVQFVEGIPDTSHWDVNTRRLCILDDLMDETNASVTQLFTKGSHHRNISVIQILQNLFSKNKEARTISLNSNYLVLFKNPRDNAQVSHLAKQIFPTNLKYVNQSYINATQNAHGYLLFDLTQDTPDTLRLRTNIFPGEQQVVFVPIKK